MIDIFKKILGIFLGLIVALTSVVSAYDVVNLPNSMPFSEALGIFNADEIASASICDIESNRYRHLSATEIKDFCYAASDITVWRKINPTPFRGTCVNFVTVAGAKISYYFDAGIQIGMYGSNNYVCYMPSRADAVKLSYLRTEFFDTANSASGGVLWNVCTTKDFLKLPQQPWAKTTVSEAAAKSLVPYDFTDKYEKNITREELAILIANFIAVAGNYANMDAYMNETGTVYLKNSFEDCNGRDEAIDQLCALGIVSGRDGTNFEPDALVTRQEAAALITRAADMFMYVTTRYNKKHADSSKIAPWALAYVNWNLDKGILSVDGEDKLYPENPMTVQQAITALSRLYDIVTYWVD